MNITQTNITTTKLGNLLECAVTDIDIPPCPDILNRFMDEAVKDEVDYNKLSAIIGADVLLSASLIKSANSPCFGIRQRVRSTNEALAVLGLKAASKAVASIILRKIFSNVQNLERFWDSSARIAQLAGWLVHKLEVSDVNAEDAYTFSLFRDSGIAVLMNRFPEYTRILALANHETVRDFTNIEENSLPTNHAMIGCLLAQSWWLPEEIYLGIRNHHSLHTPQLDVSLLPMVSRKLIAIAQLAEHIVQQLSGLSVTEEWQKIGDNCLIILNISSDEIEPLYAEAAMFESRMK